MISIITTTPMSDRAVVASCLLGSRSDIVLAGGRERIQAIGLGFAPGSAVAGTASVNVGGFERDERPTDERPTKALAAAAVAQAPAYAGAFAANGAGAGCQTKQHQLSTANSKISTTSTTQKQHRVLAMWAHRGFEPWRDPA